MEWEIPYEDIAPTSLKKFVTGKGNAKKEAMKMAATEPKACLLIVIFLAGAIGAFPG